LTNAILIALLFIELHGPTGQKLHINAAEVSTLREPLKARSHWTEGVHCVIVMTNGKVLAVSESCTLVARKLEALK